MTLETKETSPQDQKNRMISLRLKRTVEMDFLMEIRLPKTEECVGRVS